MVDKYHQSHKDRMDESRAMKKHDHEMDSDYYGMIKEDHNAPSNLPQEVVHKYYPKCSYMDAYELDDTNRGLDDTRNDDIRKIEKYHSDVKY